MASGWTDAQQERAGARDLDIGSANRHADDADATPAADLVRCHVQRRHRRRVEHVQRQAHDPQRGVDACAFDRTCGQASQQSSVEHVGRPRTPSLRNLPQPVCAPDEISALTLTHAAIMPDRTTTCTSPVARPAARGPAATRKTYRQQHTTTARGESGREVSDPPELFSIRTPPATPPRLARLHHRRIERDLLCVHIRPTHDRRPAPARSCSGGSSTPWLSAHVPRTSDTLIVPRCGTLGRASGGLAGNSAWLDPVDDLRTKYDAVGRES